MATLINLSALLRPVADKQTIARHALMVRIVAALRPKVLALGFTLFALLLGQCYGDFGCGLRAGWVPAALQSCVTDGEEQR